MKNFLKYLGICLSSFILFNSGVKAENYDMSKWINIDEFTLPNTVDPNKGQIIIFTRANHTSYRLIYNTKPNQCLVGSYSSFPIVDHNIYCAASGSTFNVDFYDTPNINSKVFNNTKTGTANDFTTVGSSIDKNGYIVYTNQNLYNYLPSNLLPTLFFDINSVQTKPKINISVLKDNYDDEFLVAQVLKLEFSIVDHEKYNYYWKYNDFDDFIKIQEDNIIDNYTTLTMTENKTIYVKIEDKDGNYITSNTFTESLLVKPKPSIEYEVKISEKKYLKETKKFYNINLKYKRMTEDYYSIYYNLKDGTKKDLGSNIQEYQIKNINDDAIIVVYIYDKDNNKIDSVTIDVSLFNKDLEKPYIRVIGQDNVNIKNRVSYMYKNTNDDDYKCYYKFGASDLKIKESCNPDNLIIRTASYNTYLQMFIYDNNNKLIDSKYVNLSYFDGYPRLSFETYYSSSINGQILNVYLSDYEENDELFYSTDNENWNKLETQDINSLTFYKNTEVYFNIYRNDEIIANAYYYVIMKNYSVSISENNTYSEIKDLTETNTGYVKSFLKKVKLYIDEFSKIIKYAFNSLNPEIKNCIIALFLLSIVCAIVLIARGVR